MSEKSRLDLMLVERGLAPSREKAKALITAGAVSVDGAVRTKAGFLISDQSVLTLLFQPNRYVSRGGLKLEKMLQKHQLDLTDRVGLDIGASSGGFTDCMLWFHAKKVYAVDVGYDQLDPKLRSDPRVVNMERTNVRNLTRAAFDDPLTFASVDVSFISLTLVLPTLYDLLEAEGEAVCLIKPQFEAGRGKVGKNGVVKDPAVHAEVIERMVQTAVEIGFFVSDLDYSPIKGPEGNLEYLLYLKKTAAGSLIAKDQIKQVVTLSHQADRNR